MKMTSNILDDVISGLQPEELPSEYIIMAKIVDFNGVEKTLRGIELENFMNDPNRGLNVYEARVILDVRKIRATMITVISNFFEELQRSVDGIQPPN